MVIFGIFLTLAASPVTARREGFLDQYHYVKRQLCFIVIALVSVFAISAMSLKWMRGIARLGLLASVLGMILVFLAGHQIKGAYRWLDLGFISIQPSEFMKPFFCIILAWWLAQARLIKHSMGYLKSFIVFFLIVAILFKQPDIGMLLTVVCVFLGEAFISGVSYYFIAVAGILFLCLIVGLYFTVPHFHLRVDRFFKIEDTVSEQVVKSLQALKEGGWFGKGPGEGVIKFHVPDAHTDFIMSVAAEEFGFLLTSFVVCTFAFVIIRTLYLARKDRNLFSQVALSGLIIQVAFQAVVNMGVTLNLLPTKGMTLPFISYGGSSMLAVGILFGFILGLTRRHTIGKGLE